MRNVLIAIAVSVLLPAIAHAGDVDAGKAMAQRWCTTCHMIEPQSYTRTVDGVPTFVSIANNPAKTPERLETFLVDPHPPMPNFHLSRMEMDDLIAYIQSLKTPKGE